MKAKKTEDQTRKSNIGMTEILKRQNRENGEGRSMEQLK